MATALAVVESELERVKGDYDGLIKTHNTLMNYGGTVLWEGEVDTEDAAKILGVSHTTVRSWRVQSKILSRETVAILSRPANAYDRAALEHLAKKRAKKRAMRQARPSARASLSSTSTP
jgi:DeoR/GlpR family transcriptional regulator of sugar metabolism